MDKFKYEKSSFVGSENALVALHNNDSTLHDEEFMKWLNSWGEDGWQVAFRLSAYTVVFMKKEIS